MSARSLLPIFCNGLQIIYLFIYLFIYSTSPGKITRMTCIQYKYKSMQVGTPQQLKPITVGPFNI
jgi:hypothetical protein